VVVTPGAIEARSASAPLDEPSTESRVRRALVIADDIGVFLAVARSLGRAGIEVGVATSELDYPGLLSRHVARVHMVPSYISRTEEWLTALQWLVRRYDYRLIFPTSDSSLVLLAEHAERLGRERVAIPNPEALSAFADKAATRALAQRLGVSVADGLAVSRSIEVAKLEALFGLPLVLKPARSYAPGRTQAKTAACVVSTREELVRELAERDQQDLIAERFFAGEGVGVSVLAERGEIRLAWQHRRLEAVGPAGRSSMRQGERLDPRLRRDVEALAQAVSLNGVAMFEFRASTATGAHILIEVNARFWGSLPLALAGGADFPALLWTQLAGDEVRPRAALDEHVRKKSLLGELERLRLSSGWAIRAHSRKVGLMLEAVIRPSAFDGWSSDDPRPHYAELRQILGQFFGKARRFARQWPATERGTR